MEYRVTWIIDIDAESLEDAARIAREIQLDKDSMATHFVVTDQNGESREVWTDQDHEPTTH